MSTDTRRSPGFAPAPATGDLPLADLHRRLGARFEPYRGVETPADYGSAEEEYEALRRGCGLVDRSYAARLEMLGEDRVRFLNGLVTCDVKSLGPGEGTYGFLTDVKGRILADVVVLALADRLSLELPPGTAGEIQSHLEKYVIVDRVEIRSPDPAATLSLVGPGAGELAGPVPGEAPYSHAEEVIHGSEVTVVREPDLGVPVRTLQVPAAAAAPFFEELLERGGGLRPVGHRALERLRIEEGRPLFGRDFGRDNFPQETGLEKAVSYDKGCYLGQEVVARIHYRGGVNRHLQGLVVAGGPSAAELAGRPVLHQGRPAGVLTSAADTARGCLGLAILHRRAEPGGSVEIEGGIAAEVVALPFAGL